MTINLDILKTYIGSMGVTPYLGGDDRFRCIQNVEVREYMLINYNYL